ncbi:hypothetical protein SLS60_003499 [Paraconiothyrium brasiliense]|uniref:Uncharacterized protein n=1 Tax=Paraconiothyrium brasiliense TaxID=300254 RepID=A0ABR3RW49_9PLEO
MQRQPHTSAPGLPTSSGVSVTPTDFDEQLDAIIAGPDFLASSEWLDRRGYDSAAQYALEAVTPAVVDEFQGGDDPRGVKGVVDTEVGYLYRDREDSVVAEESVTVVNVPYQEPGSQMPKAVPAGLQYRSPAASQYPLLQYDPSAKSPYSLPVPYQNPSLTPFQNGPSASLQYDSSAASNSAPFVSSQNTHPSASPYGPPGASSHSWYAPAASPYTPRADSPYAEYDPVTTSRTASPYPGYAPAASPYTPRVASPYPAYAPATASQRIFLGDDQTVESPALQPAPKANLTSSKAKATPKSKKSAVRTVFAIPTTLRNITRCIEKKPTPDLYQAALDIKNHIYDWHAERDRLEEAVLAKKQEHNTRLRNAAKSQSSSKESFACPEEREQRKKFMDKIRGFEKKFDTVIAELKTRGVIVPI